MTLRFNQLVSTSLDTIRKGAPLRAGWEIYEFDNRTPFVRVTQGRITKITNEKEDEDEPTTPGMTTEQITWLSYSRDELLHVTIMPTSNKPVTVSMESGSTGRLRLAYAHTCSMYFKHLSNSIAHTIDGPDESEPAKPTGLTGTVTHASVSLAWDNPADSSIRGYQILRRDKSIHETGNFAVLVGGTQTSATSYVDTDVEAEGQYVYRVKARNSAGLSPQSSYFNAELPAPPEPTPTPTPTPEPPHEPTGLTGTVTQDSVSLTWHDPEDSSITGYQVLRRDQSEESGGFDTLVDDTANANTSYVDTDVKAEGSYAYRIRARNSAGLSGLSNDFNANLPTAPPPVHPPELTGDDDATREGAIGLGDITGLDQNQFPKYTIDGDNDRVDYYRFELTEPKEINLGLRQLDADADLALEDSEGGNIKRSRKSGTANEAIHTTILEGTYYIRVDAKEEGENEYVLRYGVAEPNADKVAELRKKLGSDNDNENGEVESVGLVSNMWKSFSDKVATYSGNTWAIRFTTGPAERAWTLAAVQLQIASWHDGVTSTVALHQAGTDGVHGDLIATMSNPGRGHGKKTFAAPASVLLERNTAYTIVLSSDGVDAGSAVEYRSTNKEADDDGGIEGWSLADNSLHFSSGSWSSDRTAIKLAVVGAPLEARNALERKCLALDDSLSDPLYGCQWHPNNTGQFPGGAMQDINVEEVWASGNLGQGVNVALVDDGLDFRHDDLMENALRSRNHSYMNGAVGDRS